MTWGPPSPRVLKKPEFPSSVLFGLSFGFLLGRGGVRLLSVRRRDNLSFLDRVQFPQHGLEFVFLLLEIQLHARKIKTQSLVCDPGNLVTSSRESVPSDSVCNVTVWF